MRNLIFLICFLFITSSLSAQENSCIGTGEFSGASILFIDGSGSIDMKEGFSQSVKVVTDGVSAKERMIVLLVTERRATAQVLMDLVRPEESVWESKLVFKKKQKVFNDCVKQISDKSHAEVSKKHAASAILETLSFAKEIYSSAGQGNKRLFIYSDMIQNSDSISFYKLPAKQSVTQIVDRVTKDGLLFKLDGVAVKVAGVGGAASDKDARFTEEFWREYFSRAGATLSFYGPVFVR